MSNVGNRKWPPIKSDQPLEDKFKCPVCKELLVNVHQADDCGCRFCSDCLDQILGSEAKRCVQCNAQLVSSTKIPDKYFQKKINNLSIRCVSCEWHGILSDYADHFYSEHSTSSQAHQCEYCRDQFESSSQLSKHLVESCLKCPVDCPYKCIGCLSDDKKNESSESLSKSLCRETLQSHLDTHIGVHLKLLFEYSRAQFNSIEDSMRSMTSRSSQTKQQPHTPNSKTATAASDSLTASFTNLIKLNSEMTSPVHQVASSVTEESTVSSPNTDRRIITARGVLGSGGEGGSTSGGGEHRIEDSESMNKLTSRVDMIQNVQNGLQGDISRLSSAIERLKHENRSLKESMAESRSSAVDWQRTLAFYQVSLLSMEERLVNQEKACYDGTLLWKINNVHERMQEAKSGRQTSFYSPPFYTSKSGYKMCSRIYLNGDGNGRNTHLSLFFVILRGEYDALLRWPFRQKVTFVLIDQAMSESKENIYDTFRPDPTSSSFRRPTTDMNIASGLPLFCPLGKLMSSDHEYIKDNTLFIKIIVDTKDLIEV